MINSMEAKDEERPSTKQSSEQMQASTATTAQFMSRGSKQAHRTTGKKPKQRTQSCKNRKRDPTPEPSHPWNPCPNQVIGDAPGCNLCFPDIKCKPGDRQVCRQGWSDTHFQSNKVLQVTMQQFNQVDEELMRLRSQSSYFNITLPSCSQPVAAVSPASCSMIATVPAWNSPSGTAHVPLSIRCRSCNTVIDDKQTHPLAKRRNMSRIFYQGAWQEPYQPVLLCGECRAIEGNDKIKASQKIIGNPGMSFGLISSSMGISSSLGENSNKNDRGSGIDCGLESAVSGNIQGTGDGRLDGRLRTGHDRRPGMAKDRNPGCSKDSKSSKRDRSPSHREERSSRSRKRSPKRSRSRSINCFMATGPGFCISIDRTRRVSRTVRGSKKSKKKHSGIRQAMNRGSGSNRDVGKGPSTSRRAKEGPSRNSHPGASCSMSSSAQPELMREIKQEQDTDDGRPTKDLSRRVQLSDTSSSVSSSSSDDNADKRLSKPGFGADVTSEEASSDDDCRQGHMEDTSGQSQSASDDSESEHPHEIPGRITQRAVSTENAATKSGAAAETNVAATTGPNADATRMADANRVEVLAGTSNLAGDWRCSKTTAQDQYRYLLDHQLYVDCRLVVAQNGQQKEFLCHKLVLARGSAVFADILYRPSASDVVHIEGLEPRAVDLMLQFMYSDRVSLHNVSEALAVCAVARRYSINSLVSVCCSFIARHIEPSTVCGAIEFALQHELRDLLESCLKLLRERTETVLESKAFLTTPRCVLELLLQQNELNVSSELVLVSACEKWAGHQMARVVPAQTIIEVLGPARQLLRFLSLNATQIAQGPAVSEILGQDEKLAIFVALATSSPALPNGLSLERKPRAKPQTMQHDFLQSN